MPRRFSFEEAKDSMGYVGSEGAPQRMHPWELGFTHVILYSDKPYDWKPAAFFTDEEMAKTCFTALIAKEAERATQEESPQRVVPQGGQEGTQVVP